MNKPTISRATADVTLVSTLEHVLLEPALCVYRLTRGLTAGADVPKAFTDFVAPAVTQGFAHPDAISAFLEQRVSAIEELENLHLVHAEFQHEIQNWGFSRAFERMRSYGVDEPVSRTPYTDIVEKGESVDNIVRLDIASHMLFSRNGTVLPTAVYVDYISAQFHDGHYDLKKAAEVLKADPRVQLLGGYHRDRPLEADESPISEIPHYNADDERSAYIPFIYRPTPEDAVRLWEKQLSYQANYPSTRIHEAMFDLDILGLRNAGAVKTDSFYG